MCFIKLRMRREDEIISVGVEIVGIEIVDVDLWNGIGRGILKFCIAKLLGGPV